MQSPIDELLAQVTSLTAAISDLPEGDRQRRRLEHERQKLRDEAAALSRSGRHPVSVKHEIESILARLREIDRMRITQGYHERRSGKNIQDPGAYSVTINRLLDEQHADEVATLTQRLEQLRSSFPDVPAE